MLWHARFGSAPRYGTARCAATIRNQLSGPHWKDSIAGWIPPDIAEQIRGTCLASLPACPPNCADSLGWPSRPDIEHQAHAPGHAALLIEERGVLVAGEMLSDVLIPMLDLNDTADPIEDYLAALRLLEGAADDVDVLVPATGPSAELIKYTHGSTRIGRTCTPCVTLMFPATRGLAHRPAWDWMAGVHAGQRQRLARRSERDETPR